MITVIDIGIGNIGSVLKALKSQGATLELTDDREKIDRATKILLPGVGAFAAGMEAIRRKQLFESLRKAALDRKIPFLGICMGMQLMAEKGFENGVTEGLGILRGATVRGLDPALCPTVPHMGWNNLESTAGNPLLKGMPERPDFYFVHGFHMTDLPTGVAVNRCTYGTEITASLASGNVYGAQFHPEKSQANGLRFLKNFWELTHA